MKTRPIRKQALSRALRWAITLGLALLISAPARPTNTAPIATDDTVAHNGQVLIVDVLANDLEPDGEALTITAFSTSCSGSSSEDLGLITLQPDTPASESCTISYTLTDERGSSASATVQVQNTGLLFTDGFEAGDASAWDLTEGVQ